MAKPRLLITRFAPDAQRLADFLNAQGIFALAQPLLSVQKTAEFANARFVLTKSYDYIIAVSRNAVDYTDQALAGESWPNSDYLAVGKGTQVRLHGATRQTVQIPSGQFDSEGLLALPCLAQLSGKKILILRGVGGRELLAQTLTARGAVVEYYQPYQRVAINLNGSQMVNKRQQEGINGAIISSVELLERLIEVVPIDDRNWLTQLVIYVPSRRIASHATALGWTDVKVLSGMLDQQIADYFN
ncbi:uroporphyrinogen-III synthase [Psychromonas sp.]|uniref:uroporphyrinogen-III synthase n=1 Tax=Psychromonas sp. TaxID=1884585 RepID=UPI0039E64C12